MKAYNKKNDIISAIIPITVSFKYFTWIWALASITHRYKSPVLKHNLSFCKLFRFSISTPEQVGIDNASLQGEIIAEKTLAAFSKSSLVEGNSGFSFQMKVLVFFQREDDSKIVKTH